MIKTLGQFVSASLMNIRIHGFTKDAIEATITYFTPEEKLYLSERVGELNYDSWWAYNVFNYYMNMYPHCRVWQRWCEDFLTAIEN